MTKDETRRWAPVLLATVLAVAASQLSVFGLFFLVPLQWVRVRRGQRPFLLASVLAGLGIAGVAWAVNALGHTAWTVLDTIGLDFLLLLIVGWCAVVLMERLEWRFLFRLLAVTGAFGLVLFPVFGGLLGQGDFLIAAQQSFDKVWKQFVQTPGIDVQSMFGKLSGQEFFDLLKETFLSSFLSVLFLFWGFTAQVARAFSSPRELRSMKVFFVPSEATWVFLGLWGLILTKFLLALKGVDWKWGDVEYVVANVAFIALILHVAAGWGILHALMDQWKIPRLGQGAIRVLLVVALVTPVIGTWTVLGGLAGLAVLELWVNFRKRTQGVGL